MVMEAGLPNGGSLLPLDDPASRYLCPLGRSVDTMRNDTPLPNLDVAVIATRTLRLYRAYLDEGLPEYRARAAAIGEVCCEADDLRARADVDFTPPNRDASAEQSSQVGERDWERGGFAPGSAGWEGEI